MEEDMLTAVTQKDYPVVAPLPSIANRLSVADFQKICPSRPEVSVGEAATTSQRQANTSQIKSKLPELSISTVSCDEPSGQTQNFQIKDISILSQKDGFRSPSSPVSTPSTPNCQASPAHCEASPSHGLNLFDPRVVNSSSNSSPSISSPSRWAAKAEELRDIDGIMTASTSSLSNTATTSAKKSAIASSKKSSKTSDSDGGCSTGFEVVQDSSINKPAAASFGDNTCVRSCSVDQLGAIVDILGVPSSASHLWDNARRLVLSVEKRKRRRQANPSSFSTCPGSGHNQNCQRLVTNLHPGSQAAAKCDRLVAANCPTNHISALYGPSKNSTPLMGRKKKLAKSSSFDVETLFRSSEEINTGIQICQSCKESYEGKDLDMSDEIFDVVGGGLEDGDESLLEDGDATSIDESSNQNQPLIPPPSPRSSRRLDSVRTLLEKAKLKLSSSRGRSETREISQRLQDPGTPVHKRYSDRLGVPEQVQGSYSSPNTPLMARKRRTNSKNTSFSPVRTILSSPLLRRKKTSLENTGTTSEDDIDQIHKRLRGMKGGQNVAEPAAPTSNNPTTNYVNLETFQKQKLRHKLRQLSTQDGVEDSSLSWSPESSPKLSPRNARVSPRMCRELVLHNKAPLWNESSQVYQLDFGGRVTQESAKNFQIEHAGVQVMQFGRIDSNAYTLDFQYPFSAVQAFAVALANVTQRLK